MADNEAPEGYHEFRLSSQSGAPVPSFGLTPEREASQKYQQAKELQPTNPLQLASNVNEMVNQVTSTTNRPVAMNGGALEALNPGMAAAIPFGKLAQGAEELLDISKEARMARAAEQG